MKQVRDFHFKQFSIRQNKASHKVGTDAVLLGAWAKVNNSERILDIGTGSGVIALMLAQRTDSSVLIDALEIQLSDAQQATDNFASSPWKNRTKLIHTSLQDYEVTYKYDRVVSNPPYFNHSLRPIIQARSMVRHTDSLSFAELLKHSRRLLTSEGTLSVILPQTESQLFIRSALDQSLFLQRKCDVRSRANKPVERVLMEFGSNGDQFVHDELIIYSEVNEWSSDYRSLVHEFYLQA